MIPKKLSKFLTALWRVLALPFILLFNLIASPFRLVRRGIQFLNTDVEEHSIMDTFTSLEFEAEARASLWEHLSELRAYVVRMVIVFLVCCGVAFRFVREIMIFLQLPLRQLTEQGLRISSPGSLFDIIPKVTFAAAFILAMPYLLFEIYLYATPGLRPRERKLGLLLIPLFAVLSITSLGIAYYAFLPFVLSSALNLTSQFGIYDWELLGYLSFAAKLMALSALIVYYPFVIYIVSVVYHKPKVPLRLIVLISFCLAAMLTPGTMVLLDLGLTVMLSLIYIPTHLAIALLHKNRQESGSLPAAL